MPILTTPSHASFFAVFLFLVTSLPLADAQDPSFCVRNRTEDHQCNCYRCCDSCDCKVHGAFWRHCHGCNHCWCSPGCKCCGHECCKDCCQTCTRIVCDKTITYHVVSLSPSSGPVSGGTEVRVSGGTYSNVALIKCKFGSVEVTGELISGGEILCTAPAQADTVRTVPVEVSLDGGRQYTSNGINFTYHDCPGNGNCNGRGVCHPDSSCSCSPGYFGPGCGSTCPGGAGNPCLGRTDSGSCNPQGNCTCSSGYYGIMCENECPGGSSSPCNGHGRCLASGECQCDDGWVGYNCTRQGTCEGDECQCSGGYYGPSCALECKGGQALNCNSPNGVCGRDGNCYCQPGYYGETCTETCPGGSSNPCNGRGEQGTCSSTGVCHCQAGFYGSSCQFECPGGAANPCGGHGSCSSDGHCMCEEGWAGVDCTNECPGGSGNPCNGNGICDLDTGLCTCNGTRFYGPACENECECDGRGLCDANGECTCVNGYVGDTCEMQCPIGNDGLPCSAHGICKDGYPPTCDCHNGWYGHACENMCLGGASTPCSNNGICLHDGSCKCNPGFSGDYCQNLECPYDCHGNGHCVGGHCQCNIGFVPPFCSPPSDSPVQNSSIIHGKIGFLVSEVSVAEYVENVNLQIQRDPGSLGNVSATISAVAVSADKGLDWYMDDQNPSWFDGDLSTRNITLTIIQDGRAEPDEYFTVKVVGIEGGAVFGDITEVVVTIKANNQSNSVHAFEASFVLTKSITEIPAGSRERADFINAFNDDLAFFLGVPRVRVQVEDVTQRPKGTTIQVLFLPNHGIKESQQMAELNSLIRYMFDLCKNQSSPIYTKGEATRFIDIRYPPTLKKRAAPSIPSSTSSTNTHKTISSGGIAAAVICSVVGAALIGLSVKIMYGQHQQYASPLIAP